MKPQNTNPNIVDNKYTCKNKIGCNESLIGRGNGLSTSHMASQMNYK